MDRQQDYPAVPDTVPYCFWVSATTGDRAYWTSVPTHSGQPAAAAAAATADVNGHVPVALTDDDDEMRVHYACRTCDRLTPFRESAARRHACPGAWPSGAPCPRGYVCVPCRSWTSGLAGMLRHLESGRHAAVTRHQRFRSYLCRGCRTQFYASAEFLTGRVTGAPAVGPLARGGGTVCPLWRIALFGGRVRGLGQGHGYERPPPRGVIDADEDEAPRTAVMRRVTIAFMHYRGNPARPVLHGCLSCGRVGPFPWNVNGRVPDRMPCSACRDRNSRYYCVTCRFVFTGGEHLYLQHRHSFEHLLIEYRHVSRDVQRDRG